MNFAKRAEETESAIIKDRHFLHEHAELSFEEKETTAYLVSELEKMGIPVQTFSDYTGCIATIKGKKETGQRSCSARTSMHSRSWRRAESISRAGLRA